nr:MAG TPA: hypothetical protein [Caudoviricetes sp.]
MPSAIRLSRKGGILVSISHEVFTRLSGKWVCRKLHTLFNLQVPPEPVSIKGTPQGKEEMK